MLHELILALSGCDGDIFCYSGGEIKVRYFPLYRSHCINSSVHTKVYTFRKKPV